MKATNLKPLHLFVRDSKHSEEALKTEDSETEVKWKNYSHKCLLVMGGLDILRHFPPPSMIGQAIHNN